MGDLVGEAVEGTLYYVPFPEIQRVRNAMLPPENRAALVADMCRLNALYMIAQGTRCARLLCCADGHGAPAIRDDS
jgi:hypothetical protein